MPGNQLGGESSPYLLQHARNPVQWRPWGEAALEEARQLDRPIFLSIGYATCHWCHVMAHESFEDDDVAELLNRWFVPIKVDREERPDVDSVYMTVCQMMNGHGGWPLTVVLTPDLRPFFSGTYFPRSTRGGRIGMLDLLPRLARVWEERRTEVEESARHVTQVLRASTEVEPGEAPTGYEVEQAVRTLLASHDPDNGGFGPAPKFPSPHTLVFLLRVWEAGGNPRHLEVVVHTLNAMAAGGIHDQLAGGFHRYSTDASWKLPHFEKMLYDQALLATAYLEAFLATGDRRLAEIASRTLDYVTRDLTDAGGAFHSAEDADSEGEEGKYYVWTHHDIRQALGDEDDVRTAMLAFGASEEGNFADEATGERTGANVLLGSDAGLDSERLDSIRARLLEARLLRPRPDRDDKILADWNGLAVAALARAGAAFRRADYIAAAERAAGFVLDYMTDEAGRVFHTWRDGVARIPGLADDYASLALAGLELYGATYQPKWLDASTLLATNLIEHFEAPAGGFRQVSDDGAETLVHVVESADGALPSANSMAIDVLLRLTRLTGDTAFEAAAFRALDALGARVRSSPSAHTALLASVLQLEAPTAEAVVVEGRDGGVARESFLSPLQHQYHPRIVTLLVPSAPDARGEVARLAPFTADMRAPDGRAAGYLCRDRACGLPMTDPAEFLDAVRGV